MQSARYAIIAHVVHLVNRDYLVSTSQGGGISPPTATPTPTPPTLPLPLPAARGLHVHAAGWQLGGVLFARRGPFRDDECPSAPSPPAYCYSSNVLHSSSRVLHKQFLYLTQTRRPLLSCFLSPPQAMCYDYYTLEFMDPSGGSQRYMVCLCFDLAGR